MPNALNIEDLPVRRKDTEKEYSLPSQLKEFNVDALPVRKKSTEPTPSLGDLKTVLGNTISFKGPSEAEYHPRDPRHPEYDERQAARETMAGISAVTKAAFSLLWAEAALSGAMVKAQEGAPVSDIFRAIPENLQDHARSIVQDIAVARGEDIPQEDIIRAKDFGVVWSNYYEAVTGEEAPFWYTMMSSTASLIGLSVASPKTREFLDSVGREVGATAKDIKKTIAAHNQMMAQLKVEKAQFISWAKTRGIPPREAQKLATALTRDALQPGISSGSVDTGLLKTFGTWVKPPAVVQEAGNVAKKGVKKAIQVQEKFIKSPITQTQTPVSRPAARFLDSVLKKGLTNTGVELFQTRVEQTRKLIQAVDKALKHLPEDQQPIIEDDTLGEKVGTEISVSETPGTPEAPEAPEQQALVEQARQAISEGKSVEEFVEGQTTYYRGGEKGQWITELEEFAKEYGEVREQYLTKEPTLLDAQSPEAVEIADNLGVDEADLYYNPTKELDSELKARGYDGFENKDNIYLVDQSLIQDKAQLRQAYDKAQGEIEPTEIKVGDTFRNKKLGGFYKVVSPYDKANDEWKIQDNTGHIFPVTNETLKTLYTPIKQAQGAEVSVEPFATVSQKKVAHAWARKKGLVDSKGEVTDRYRLLAEKSTGKRSMADMTEKEAETFIDTIKRMSDIRRTLNDYPSEKRFKTRPGLTTPFTPQNITAEILGLKPFVEPMERARMTIMKEESVLRREIHDVLKALGKKSKVSRENMALALNKYENSSDLPVDKFDEESKAVFDYFRTLTRSMLERMNAIREEYGLELIEGIDAYFRHIVDPLAQGIIYGNDKLPEALKKWASENLSDKVYNPMERKRKIEDKLLEYFSKDIEYVMNAMIRAALKEIHMTGPKQLINDLKSVYKKPSKKDLEKMSPEERAIADQIEEMPVETEKWLTDYVKIVLLREEQTTLDQWTNAWLKTSEVGKFVKSQFLKHGIVLSDQAFTNLITNISKLPLYGTLALRPKPIIRNKFQRVQDIALYGLQAVWRGALPTSNYPLLEKLKTDSLFRDVYSGIEGMPGDLKQQIGGILLKGFQWSAFSNVDQTMNAAFHWTMDKIQDPAKRDLGWADPQRDYTEDKTFLYPSERELVLKEMEFGAQTTQYLYMGMGMPQLFRYKAASGVTRLQSWWMNHWFNFLREATHRSLTGEVGWEATTISKGTGPLGRDEIQSRRPKVDAKSRTNLLWYLLIGGTVLNTLGYGRSFLFGTMPLQPPPVAAFAINLMTYLASDDENTRRKAKRGMKNAALTFIPGYLGYKDVKAFLSGDAPLSSYLFYNKIKEQTSFRPK